MDTAYGFECKCKPGYNGLTCETETQTAGTGATTEAYETTSGILFYCEKTTEMLYIG